MPHIISTQFLKLIPLMLIVAGLLSYNFMSAQWTGPTAAPPYENASTTINLSPNYQAKTGDLGAVRMRAGQYCNADGTICTTPGVAEGLGYNQSWKNINLTPKVWHTNTSSRPIMFFHRNIYEGTVVSIRNEAGQVVVLDFRNASESLDTGSTFIVPAGHSYYFHTSAHNDTVGAALSVLR